MPDAGFLSDAGRPVGNAGGGRAGCSAKNLYGAVKLDEDLSEKV